MSYIKQGNHFKYFVPNILLATTTSVPLRAIDIGAASGDHGEYLCVKPCRIRQLQFTMTEEVAGGTSVAPRVIFTKRPTPLSASSEVVVGTVIVPDATAIGKTVYKTIAPVNMAVGDSIEVSWVIGTGTPTGIGLASFICEDDPETEANNLDMVASA
jgi:hypothetical protein